MGGEYILGGLQQKPRNLFRTPKPPEPYRVPEWKLQAVVVSDWHKRIDRGERFAFAGDLNGVRLTPSQAGKAKLTGLTPGETDLRIYLPTARFKMIEMKADGGALSKAQKERHSLLRGLGFEIEVVKAKTEESAIMQCGKLLDGWLAASPKETFH
jgi:hypothetical protein